MRAVTILTLLAASLSVTAWAVSFMQAQVGQPPRPKDEKAERKTLRDIARERDVETEVWLGELDAEYKSLRDLARHADAVVLGRIVGGESYFDGDDHIATAYTVDVRRVLKDGRFGVPGLERREPPAPLTTPLKFIRPGGVVYVNGHRASARLKGDESLSVGKDYILFLWWSSSSKAYRLAGGMSGVALVTDAGTVETLASVEETRRRYKGTRLEDFVSEILPE